MCENLFCALHLKGLIAIHSSTITGQRRSCESIESSHSWSSVLARFDWAMYFRAAWATTPSSLQLKYFKRPWGWTAEDAQRAPRTCFPSYECKQKTLYLRFLVNPSFSCWNKLFWKLLCSVTVLCNDHCVRIRSVLFRVRYFLVIIAILHVRALYVSSF